MSVFNTRPVTDVRKILSGKDGGFFDEEGNLMATVQSYTVTVTVNNGTFRPIGDAQEHSAMQSYSVSLTVTKIKIESDKFTRDMVEGMQNHAMPIYDFQGVIRSPYNASEERIVYRDCVPDGSFDLQNVTNSDFIQQEITFIVNQPPELQSLLSAT